MLHLAIEGMSLDLPQQLTSCAEDLDARRAHQPATPLSSEPGHVGFSQEVYGLGFMELCSFYASLILQNSWPGGPDWKVPS